MYVEESVIFCRFKNKLGLICKEHVHKIIYFHLTSLCLSAPFVIGTLPISGHQPTLHYHDNLAGLTMLPSGTLCYCPQQHQSGLKTGGSWVRLIFLYIIEYNDISRLFIPKSGGRGPQLSQD